MRKSNVVAFSAGVLAMGALMTPLVVVRKQQLDRAALNLTVLKEMASTMLETAPPETLAKLGENIDFWEIILADL